MKGRLMRIALFHNSTLKHANDECKKRTVNATKPNYKGYSEKIYDSYKHTHQNTSEKTNLFMRNK